MSLKHTHTTYFCASVLAVAMVRDIMFSGCPSLHTSHFTEFFILILKDSFILSIVAGNVVFISKRNLENEANSGEKTFLQMQIHD